MPRPYVGMTDPEIKSPEERSMLNHKARPVPMRKTGALYKPTGCRCKDRIIKRGSVDGGACVEECPDCGAQVRHEHKWDLAARLPRGYGSKFIQESPTGSSGQRTLELTWKPSETMPGRDDLYICQQCSATPLHEIMEMFRCVAVRMGMLRRALWIIKPITSHSQEPMRWRDRGAVTEHYCSMLRW